MNVLYMDVDILYIMRIYCACFVISVVLVVFCLYKKNQANLRQLGLDHSRLVCVIYEGQLGRRRLVCVIYEGQLGRRRLTCVIYDGPTQSS
jgi:hypothetical protein